MTIKELRLMKGLTQTEFAKAIGIGLSSLTGYEAGKREPGEKALAAIKEVYGVDLATASPVPAPTSAPVEAAPAEKKTRKPRAKKEAVAPAPAEEKVEKKARKPRAKKEAVAPAPAEAKVEKKAKKTASIIIQSAMGGEITPEEILSRVGDVDKVYVRPDQNAIYWVKGEETGAINIW